MNPRARQPRGYYPIFTDLAGRRCVVVGGGLVAQRKVTTLLRFGAAVTVISPVTSRRIGAYALQGRVRWVRRTFRPTDLRGAWLVYAATDDQRINELVYRRATRQRIFTNVVDQKPLCSFIAPAIVKRGELVIAISTGGASPLLAKRLRRDLERSLGADYARMLQLLRSLRGPATRHLPSPQARKRYFERLFAGRAFGLVRAGKDRAARQEAMVLLRRLATTNGA